MEELFFKVNILTTLIVLCFYIAIIITDKEETKKLESIDIYSNIIRIIILGGLFSSFIIFIGISFFILVGLPVMFLNYIRGKGFKFD